MALVVRLTGRSQNPVIPRWVCRTSPVGSPILPGSKPVLTASGAPPPWGRDPAKAGRKLPQADCPQRKALPGPGNRSSAPLPCRFFRPAGQRTGFGHSRSTAPSGKGAPAKAGRKLPQPTVHSGRLHQARATGHLLHFPAVFSILSGGEPRSGRRRPGWSGPEPPSQLVIRRGGPCWPLPVGLLPPWQGAEKGDARLVAPPPVHRSRRAPERGRWQGASRHRSSPTDGSESRAVSVKASAFPLFDCKKGPLPAGGKGSSLLLGCCFTWSRGRSRWPSAGRRSR